MHTRRLVAASVLGIDSNGSAPSDETHSFPDTSPVPSLRAKVDDCVSDVGLLSSHQLTFRESINDETPADEDPCLDDRSPYNLAFLTKLKELASLQARIEEASLGRLDAMERQCLELLLVEVTAALAELQSRKIAEWDRRRSDCQAAARYGMRVVCTGELRDGRPLCQLLTVARTILSPAQIPD